MFLKNSNFLFALFFVALSPLFFGCSDDEGAEPMATVAIFPGSGIESIKLGDTGQDVFDAFGETPDSWGGSGGQYVHFLVYLNQGLIFYLEANNSETLDLTKKVKRIIIESPFDGKTEEGVGIGSSMAEVKAAYGEPDSEKTSFGVTEHTYNIGLVIEYDEQGNDTVAKITIE